MVPIRARFPDAHIVAIERDPEVVSIFRTLNIGGTHDLDVMTGDVREKISSGSGFFDLVLCDVSDEGVTSEILRDASWVRALTTKMRRGSWLIVQTGTDRAETSTLQEIFSFQWDDRNAVNTLSAFRTRGSGTLGDPLPPGFLPFRAIPPFIERDFRELKRVAMNGVVGTSWRHGPLNFEGYISDTEPEIPRIGTTRLVLWQPLTRTDRPKGWIRLPVQPNATITGVGEISNPETYWEHWSEHAKRHRQKFLKDDRFEMIDLTYDRYMDIYRRIPRAIGITGLLCRIIDRKVERHGSLMVFFGVREKSSGAIVSGFNVLNIPEAHTSVHIASFILPEVRQTSVGVGMVDEWFRRSIALGIRFNDFDLFRAEGEPMSWQGFSQFKSQFVTHFVRYPKPLARFGR